VLPRSAELTEREPTITRDEIAHDLAQLGVEPGDCLIVHASLSSLGWVEGGARALVDALRDAVFPRGTIAVPTHKRPGDVYDVLKTGCHTGAIPDTLRRQPDALRSLHPTHSVAAIGYHARYVIDGHRLGTALGVDSPFDRMSRLGGRIVLLGVGHRADSMVHVAEARYPVPYLDVPFSDGYAQKTIRIVAPGETEFVVKGIKECPGCSANFGTLDEPMTRTGRQVIGHVGEAECRLMLAEDLIRTVHELLDDDLGALLCDREQCPVCPRARATLPG
jgi:aminoglycoside N3'-acetyltransferase